MEKIFFGQITDISSEGQGVTHHPSGLTVFVEDGWPGDEGELEILRQEKRYATARWRKRERSSHERISARCPHHGFAPGQCGGCPWMGIDYQAQLRVKQKYLQDLLSRYHIGLQASPIHPSSKEFGFRNRAQLKTNGDVVGYVSPKTRTMAPIDDCMILDEQTRVVLQAIRARLPDPQWYPTGKYAWNFIDIDCHMQPDDVVLNKRRPFQQANTAANEYMREWVRTIISSMSPDTAAIELFCGSGNFTEVLIEHYKELVACELPGDALKRLREKQLAGVKMVGCDLFQESQWAPIRTEGQQASVLFLDPPREGFKLLPEFVRQFPLLKTIIYISCDPYTFVTNIHPLLQEAWTLKAIQPVDQFPHTAHMELLAVLQHKSH